MVAMAAAPGFSPLVGSALGDLLGWQLIFAGVAVFAAVLAFQYARYVGETNPAARRVAMPLSAVANAYGRLATDRRFILPALAVALILGCLFTFFATAPAILIGVLGLTGFQLALYFAATVIVVFSAGFLAPRLSQRWGQRAIAMFGALVALSGSLLILVVAGAPGLSSITAGLILFLFGMGLTNPLGTAIALQPFGSQAGTASALLGFLQMSCAALGTSLATVLPLEPTVSLAAIMTAGSLLAVAAFFPVAFAHPKPSEVV
jgi:DHA1 family bicyclomycin/chloramphenicol resistance-like MFS transporter